MGRLGLVDRRTAARYGAPLAFLAAVTTAVLLVRAGLDDGGSGRPEQAPPTTAEVAPSPSGTIRRQRFYRIRRGDTLASVADRFSTTVEQLVGLNPGIDPTALRVGHRIRVR